MERPRQDQRGASLSEHNLLLHSLPHIQLKDLRVHLYQHNVEFLLSCKDPGGRERAILDQIERIKPTHHEGEKENRSISTGTTRTEMDENKEGDAQEANLADASNQEQHTLESMSILSTDKHEQQLTEEDVGDQPKTGTKESHPTIPSRTRSVPNKRSRRISIFSKLRMKRRALSKANGLPIGSEAGTSCDVPDISDSLPSSEAPLCNETNLVGNERRSNERCHIAPKPSGNSKEHGQNSSHTHHPPPVNHGLSLKAGLRYYPTVCLVRVRTAGKEGAERESQTETEKQGERVAMSFHDTKRTDGSDINTAEGKKGVRELYFSPITVGGVDKALKVMFNLTDSAETDMKNVVLPQVKEQVEATDKLQTEVATASHNDSICTFPTNLDKVSKNMGKNNSEFEKTREEVTAVDSNMKSNKRASKRRGNIKKAEGKTEIESRVVAVPDIPDVTKNGDEVTVIGSNAKADKVTGMTNVKKSMAETDTESDIVTDLKADVNIAEERAVHTIQHIERSVKTGDKLTNSDNNVKAEKNGSLNKAEEKTDTENEAIKDQKTDIHLSEERKVSKISDIKNAEKGGKVKADDTNLKADESATKMNNKPNYEKVMGTEHKVVTEVKMDENIVEGKRGCRSTDIVKNTKKRWNTKAVQKKETEKEVVVGKRRGMIKQIETRSNEGSETTAADDNMKADGAAAAKGSSVEGKREDSSAEIEKTLNIEGKTPETENAKKHEISDSLKATDKHEKLDNVRREGLHTQIDDREPNKIRFPLSNGSNAFVIRDIRVTLSDAFKNLKDELKRSALRRRSKSLNPHLNKQRNLHRQNMIKEHIKKLIALDKEKRKEEKKDQDTESTKAKVDCRNVLTPVCITSGLDRNTSPKHPNETSTAKQGSSELLPLRSAPVVSIKDHSPLTQIQTNIPLKKRMFRESTEPEVNVTARLPPKEPLWKRSEDGTEVQQSVSCSSSKAGCESSEARGPESLNAQIQKKVLKKACAKENKRDFPPDNKQDEFESGPKPMMEEDATVNMVEEKLNDKQTTAFEGESGYKTTQPVLEEVRNEGEKPKDTRTELSAFEQEEDSLESPRQSTGVSEVKQAKTEEKKVSPQNELSVQENILKKKDHVKEEQENNLRIRLKRKRGQGWVMERAELEGATEIQTKPSDSPPDPLLADPFKAILDSVSVLNVEMSKGERRPQEAEKCLQLEQTAKAGQAAWEICTKNVHSKLKKKEETSDGMESNAQPKGDFMGYSSKMLKDKRFFDEMEQWLMEQTAGVKVESVDSDAQPLAPIRLCRKTKGWGIVDGVGKRLRKGRRMRGPLMRSKSHRATERHRASSESLISEVPFHKVKEEFQSPCQQLKESCCNMSRRVKSSRSENVPLSLSLSSLSLNSPFSDVTAEDICLSSYPNVKEILGEKRAAEVVSKKRPKKDLGMRDEFDPTQNICLSHNLFQINKSLSRLQALNEIDKTALFDNSETVSCQGQQKPQSPLLIFPDKSPCSDFGFGNADELIECLNLEGYYPDNSQSNLPNSFSDFCQGEPPNTGSFSSPFSQSPSETWNPETPYIGSPSPCGSFSPPNDFVFPDLNLTKNITLLSGPDLSSKEKTLSNTDFNFSSKDAEGAPFSFDFTMAKAPTTKDVPKPEHLMESDKNQWNHKDSFMFSGATSSDRHSQPHATSSQAQGVESIIPGCSFNSRTEFAKVQPFSMERTQGSVHSLTANRNQSVGPSQASVAGMYNLGAFSQPLKPFHAPLLGSKSNMYPHKVIGSVDAFHRTCDKTSLSQSSNPIKIESGKQNLNFCRGNMAAERADFATKFQSTKHSSPNPFSSQLSFNLPSSLTGSHQGGDHSHTLGKANDCPNTSSSSQADRVHPFYYVTSSKTSSSVLQNVTSSKAQDIGSGCLTKNISSQKPFTFNQSPQCHSLPLGKSMSHGKPHAMVAPTQNIHLNCSESSFSANKHQPGYPHCDPVDFAFSSAFSTDVSQQNGPHVTQRVTPEQERQANKSQTSSLACSTQAHPPYVVNFTGDHSVTLGYGEDGEGLNYSGVPTPNYTYHCLMDPSGTQGRLVLEPCGLSSNNYSSSPSVGGFPGSKGQGEQTRKDPQQQEQPGSRPFVSHHFSTSSHSLGTSLSDRKPKRLRLVVTDGTVDLDLHYTD